MRQFHQGEILVRGEQVPTSVRKHFPARRSLQRFIKRTASVLLLRFRKPKHSPRHRISAESVPPGLKPYAPPAIRKLILEQARLLVLGHSTLRDRGAQDLMHLLFPDADHATHS